MRVQNGKARSDPFISDPVWVEQIPQLSYCQIFIWVIQVYSDNRNTYLLWIDFFLYYFWPFYGSILNRDVSLPFFLLPISSNVSICQYRVPIWYVGNAVLIKHVVLIFLLSLSLTNFVLSPQLCWRNRSLVWNAPQNRDWLNAWNMLHMSIRTLGNIVLSKI